MNINIGENIRHYRMQKELTQEKVAESLGVSCQAVSRWELGGSYPDVEMLPKIANYFHITLDELFGHNGEQEEIVNEIIKKADEYLNSRDKIEECICFLREASQEFPTEGRIWYRYGLALSFLVSRNNDIRIKNDNIVGDGVEFDIENNINNDLLRELIRVHEKTLTMDISRDERDVMTISLSSYYAVMGMYDKAQQLASKQSIIYAGREYLTALASDEIHREGRIFDLMIALFRMLKQTVMWSVGTNHFLRSSEKGIELLMGTVGMCKLFFGEAPGLLHSDLYDIYTACICIYARMKNYGELKRFLDLALYHRKEYERVCQIKEYKHSSLMFSSTVYDGTAQPEYTLYRLCDIIKSLPEDIKLKLSENIEYKELFGI